MKYREEPTKSSSNYFWGKKIKALEKVLKETKIFVKESMQGFFKEFCLDFHGTIFLKFPGRFSKETVVGMS